MLDRPIILLMVTNKNLKKEFSEYVVFKTKNRHVVCY